MMAQNDSENTSSASELDINYTPLKLRANEPQLKSKKKSMTAEMFKLRVDILVGILQAAAIVGAVVVYLSFTHQKNALELEKNSAKSIAYQGELAILSSICKGDDCEFHIDIRYKIKNISNRMQEVSMTRWRYYTLGAEVLSENLDQKGFEIIEGPSKVVIIGGADSYGWKLFYERRYIIDDSFVIDAAGDGWQADEVGGGLTGVFAPGEEKIVADDLYVKAKKGDWLGSRLYFEANYQKDGHKHRYKPVWLKLVPVTQKSG